MAELYIGLISGTSMDGVSAALGDFSGPVPRLVHALSEPIPEDLRRGLSAFYRGETPPFTETMALDVALGRLFAAAARRLMAAAGSAPAEIRAIGSHGQTVYHRPDGPLPFTVQLGDPNVIAELTGVDTAADFRRRDMAAGGQGAPLAPLFHEAVFRTVEEDRAVLNLGGIANLTLLPCDPASPIAGFDTGPANTLMDGWSERHLGQPYDADGAWAAGGTADPALLQVLRDDPYFRRPPPKSTGREYFTMAWLDARLATVRPPAPRDVQATLCRLTAATAAEALWDAAPGCRRLLCCGGGAYNAELLRRLAAELPQCRVESTAACGLAPEWVEAMTFAWLAREAVEGRSLDLRSVTGSSHPVPLGAVYRGR